MDEEKPEILVKSTTYQTNSKAAVSITDIKGSNHCHCRNFADTTEYNPVCNRKLSDTHIEDYHRSEILVALHIKVVSPVRDNIF